MTIAPHPDTPQPVPAICELAGLGDEDCEDCPWPACVLDLPNGGGNGLAYMLGCAIVKWRERTARIPTYHAQPWYRERVRSWMFRVAFGRCVDMVNHPARYNAERLEEARIFVAIVREWRKENEWGSLQSSTTRGIMGGE